MGLFGFGKSGGPQNVIRCDEREYVIWKWRPTGQELGATKRENSIRKGSSLRVKEGEVAAFVVNMGGQQQTDFIEGPWDKTLESENLPVTAMFKELLTGESSLKQAELYFINVQGTNQMKFGVPFFNVTDPRQPQLAVPVAVRGTINFCLSDYREFIRQNRLQDTSMDDLQEVVKPVLSRVVKEVVADFPAQTGTLLIQMERHISKVVNAVEPTVKARLAEMGIQIKAFDITAIECDKDSYEYQELYSLTQGMSAEMQRAQQEDVLERMRIQREEEHRAMRMATETANLGAHYIDKQAETIKYTATQQTEAARLAAESAAKQAEAVKEGLKNMHKMAGGRGWYGGDGMTGVMMAGMMAQQMGQAMNGQMGQGGNGNAAPAANPSVGVGQMQGVGIQPPSASMPGVQMTSGTASVPPPMPQASQYFVAVNGQQTGPYAIQQLQQMAVGGQLTAQTYVWKQGMAQWEMAASVSELAMLFGMPPTPPPAIPQP